MINVLTHKQTTERDHSQYVYWVSEWLSVGEGEGKIHYEVNGESMRLEPWPHQ